MADSQDVSGRSTAGVGAWSPRGLLTPFQRDQKTDFANGMGRALMQSQLTQVLMTRAASEDGSSYGELEWDQEAGSQLHRVRHMRLNDPGLVELFRFRVAQPIAEQLSTVRLRAVGVELDRQQRASRVRLRASPVDARGNATGEDFQAELAVVGDAP